MSRAQIAIQAYDSPNTRNPAPPFLTTSRERSVQIPARAGRHHRLKLCAAPFRVIVIYGGVSTHSNFSPRARVLTEHPLA